MRAGPPRQLFGWSDRSGAQAARQLRAEHDEVKIHARTGCRFHPSYWPAKLLRLRTEEPSHRSSQPVAGSPSPNI